MHIAIIKALEERQRQISEECFTAEHDDQWKKSQLKTAAMCYLYHSEHMRQQAEFIFTHWPHPWHIDWYKPSEDPKRNIIKAMALLSAEYDRLERAEAQAVMPAWSNNGEEFYDEIADAINDHKAGDEILVGDIRRFKGSDFTGTRFDESIIDSMQDMASMEIAAFAESYLDHLLKNDQHPARVVLRTLIDTWADEHCQPDFWTADNVRSYTLTTDDIRLVAK